MTEKKAVLPTAAPISEKIAAFSEGYKASPACPSDNSTEMISMELWRDDTDRGKPKNYQNNLKTELVPRSKHTTSRL
jgi:hypothetical protein